MAILTTDVLLYKSENQTDTGAGGGRMSSNSIACGVDNNLFPNTSRVDRLTGRVQLKKFFVRIDTEDTDTYSGAHVCLKTVPTDPSVGIILFDCQDSDDYEKWNETQDTTFKPTIEDYYVQDASAGTATNHSQLIAGEKVITFLMSEVSMYQTATLHWSGSHYYVEWKYTTDNSYSLDVNIGDVIFLEDGALDEYAIVTKIEDNTTVLLDTSDNYQAISYRNVYLLEPLQNAHSADAISVYRTVVNDDWKAYGTVQIVANAAINDTKVYVDTPNVRLIPKVGTNTIVNEFYPIPPPTQGAPVYYSEIGLLLNETQNPYFSEYILTSPGQSIYVHIVKHYPILPGSVWVLMRSNGAWVSLNDDGLGSLSGSGTGTIDYATTGTINIQYYSRIDPDEDTHIIIFYQTETMHDVFRNVSLPGGSYTLPYNFDLGVTNILESSLLIRVHGVTGRYRIRDNGVGVLVPDPRVSIAMEYEGTPMQANNNAVLSFMYGGQGVILGGGGSSYGGNSSDGLNWTYIRFLNESTTAYDNWSDFNPGGELYVVDGSGVFYKASPNSLRTITGITNRPTTGADGVCYDETNQRFIAAVSSAVAANHKRTVAGDIMTWEAMTYPGVALYTICYGRDGSGGGIVLAFDSTGGSGRSTTDAGDTWTSFIPAFAGTKLRGIVYEDSTQTFIIYGDGGGLSKTTDGGVTWEDLSGNVPASWLGQDIKQFATNDDGIWIATRYAGTATADVYIMMSDDQGLTWAEDFWKSTWPGATAVTPCASVIWNPVLDKFVIIGGFDNTGVYTESFISTTWTGGQWPADPCGTIDYVAGTGSITAGETLNSTPVAQFFLKEIQEREFALPFAGAEDITVDTTVIQATAYVGNANMTIIEDIGAAVGDGTWTMNREAGYVLVNFDNVVKHGTIRMAFEYDSMSGVVNFADIDASRFPTDGMVPGFKENDIVVIRGITTPDTWDMAVVTAVNQNSISFANPLTNAYTANDAIICNALVLGDLQASLGIYFTQQVWDGVTYGDVQVGNPADGTYDSVTYPVTVLNNGAEKGKWVVEIASVEVVDQSYEVDVWHEDLGAIATGLFVGPGPGGSPKVNIQIPNPNTDDPGGTRAYYFFMDNAGWGAGWQVGNIIRFNTEEAGHPYWVCRVVDARTSAAASDQFILENRGDVA